MRRKDYITDLISEMSNFILEGEPTRLVISLHQEEDGLHLAVLDSKMRTDEEIESITQALNCSRRPELAGYYGSMTGHDMLGASRLNLIGWQVKHADVTRSDSGTKIDLWLGSDRFNPASFNLPKDD
jgi:hypothetical protein